MEIIVRVLCYLNVFFGKFFSPLYSYWAKLPRKPLPALKHPEILTLSATTLARKIRTKELTSVQVVKTYIERCQQVNGLLNAMVGPTVADSLKLDQMVDLKNLNAYYMLDNGSKKSEMPVDPNIKKAILKAVSHFENSLECPVQEMEFVEKDDIIEMCMTKTTQINNVRSALVLRDLQNKSSYSLEVLMMRLNIELCFLFVPKNKRIVYASAINNLSNRLKELLNENGVLFYPTFTSLAHFKTQGLWKMTGIGYPMIVNILGFPACNIPMGLNEDGIPVGFQVIAAANQDRLCLTVAEELEKVFGGWVPPPMSS